MCRMDWSQGQLQEAVAGVWMEPHVVSAGCCDSETRKSQVRGLPES